MQLLISATETGHCGHNKMPENHWFCIAHLSVEAMLKLVVTEEKKIKNIESEWAGSRSMNDLDRWYSESFMFSLSWLPLPTFIS